MSFSEINTDIESSKNYENEQRGYFLLDFIKALFAICVIAIHTEPLRDITSSSVLSIYNLVISIAVPFFFAATGFLEARKFINGKTRVIVKKYIKLYIVWSIAYLPLTLWGVVYNGESLLRTVYSIIRGYFLVGEQFCSWPLWFLLSILYGSLIIGWLVRKKQSIRVYLFSALVVYTAAIVLNHAEEINPLFGKMIALTIGNGRLLTGLSFMFIGIAVRECSELREQDDKVLPIAIGGGTAVCIISVMLRLPYSTTYITSLLIVPILLIICIYGTKRSRDAMKRHHVSLFFRNYSKVAYFTHMYFVFLFQYDVLQFVKIREQGIGCFISAVTGTVIVYVALKSLSDIKKIISNKRI